MAKNLSRLTRSQQARPILSLLCLFISIFSVGCLPEQKTSTTPPVALDLTKEGQLQTSGDWSYTYEVTNPGTRSEGTHGTLSYKGVTVPQALNLNDFYETPWGPMYWVGKPIVLFGGHGWMPNPVAYQPSGHAMIDPSIVHSNRFIVQIKIVAPEELATPDRLEKDKNILDVLKPFNLSQVHVQRDWFVLGNDPVTLHDTKRWGTLKVCRSDTHMRYTPTLAFTCTSDLSIDTTPKPVSLDELMAVPEFPDKPSSLDLSPQVSTLQPIQCTLSPVIGDPLVLYVVCRILDQGDNRTMPDTRVIESDTTTQR